MNKNFLLIVEGKDMEPTIFEKVFSKYGYNVIRNKEKLEIDINKKFELVYTELDDEKDNIIIIQGPRTRIWELVKSFEDDSFNIDRLINNERIIFTGVFLVYDVDHTMKEDLEKAFNKYQDEASGMLLVSSPCIEVLVDLNRSEELNVKSFEEYKSEMNKKVYNNGYNEGVKKYIIENFEKLVKYYLEKNYKESSNPNVMEHPEFVIEEINKYNVRIHIDGKEDVAIYRYFTTVLYVCIAYIKGLTKDINNYQNVYVFFSNKK